MPRSICRSGAGGACLEHACLLKSSRLHDEIPLEKSGAAVAAKGNLNAKETWLWRAHGIMDKKRPGCARGKSFVRATSKAKRALQMAVYSRDHRSAQGATG